MSGNVRTQHVRYVLITHSGVVLDDYQIVLRDNSSVLIYTSAGETYEGDLLALETFAKINRAIACPVSPPADFTGEVCEDYSAFLQTEDDWADDADTGIHQFDIDSAKAADSAEAASSHPILPEGTSSRLHEGVDTPSAVSSNGGVNLQLEEHVDLLPRQEEEVSRPCPEILQGAGGTDGSEDVFTNPYHQHSEPGLAPSGKITYEDVASIIGDYGTVRVNPNIPRVPAVVKRDLGNCLMGMPAWVGTTLVGRLRPDTGGEDPPIDDHIAWLYYGSPARKRK